METSDIAVTNSNNHELGHTENDQNVLLLNTSAVTLFVNKLNGSYNSEVGQNQSVTLTVDPLVPCQSTDTEIPQGLTLTGSFNDQIENTENPTIKKLDIQNIGPEQVPQTDVFMCGICGHTSFKIMDYLHHKILHAAPRAGICCEFCNIPYTRQVTLTEHYRLKHKILFPRNKLTSNQKTVKQKSVKKKPQVSSKEIELINSSEILKEDGEYIRNELSKSSDTTVFMSQQQENSGLVDSSTQVNGQLKMENDEQNTNHKIENFDDNFDFGEVERNESPGAENGQGEFLSQSNATETYVNVEIDPNFKVDEKGDADVLANLNNSDFMDKNKDFHFILLSPTSDSCGVQFKCLHCSYKTHWKSYICKHMKKCHSDTLSIHQAIAVVNPYPDTADHKLMKMSEFTALQAKLRAESSRKRFRGIEKQDLLGTYPCTKCDKIFTRLRYLRKHLHTHRTEQKYLCDECGKAFKTQSYLSAHHKTHKKTGYSCNQCEFTSSINSAIHAHRQIHNEGSVICDVCGFAYIDKSTLMKHKRVHDPDRPYACTFPGCTWRFLTEVMCNAHVKKHTTEGKFKCSKCGYIFRHKHHLRRHEAKVHDTVPPAKSKDMDQEEASILTKESQEEAEEIQNTVNLIVNSDMDSDQFELQNALQNHQLVIATDEEGNTINYEVTDIAMNVAYQTLLQGGDVGDTHTILIPQNVECSQIILNESEATMESESVMETAE